MSRRGAGRGVARCASVIIIPFVVALAFPAAAAGQRRGATAPLASDHWAYGALDRLAAAGRLGEHQVDGGRPLSVGAVAAALRHAARRTAGERGELAGFTRDVLERFREEFPLACLADACPAADRRFFGAGRVRLGYAREVFGATRRERVMLDTRLVVRPAHGFALLYEPALWLPAGPDRRRAEWVHDRFAAVARWGPVWLYGGRERLEFAAGVSGGLVLSDAVAFDGVAVGLEEPIRLPWLGAVRGTAFVSRIGGDALGGPALLGAMRLSFAPHPRIEVGLNRTLLAVAEARGERIDPGDVLRMLAGKHTAFEDQRASVAVRLRTDVAGWPVQSYLEWGFEDTAGIEEDPGVVAGVFLPVIPGIPGISLRYEYAAFGEAARLFSPCCSEPRSWYRHSGIRDRYASGDGVPLGHPLGGYGGEHRVVAGAWLAGARVRVRAEAFARHRLPGNILFEHRPGASRGGLFALKLRLRPAMELELRARGEEGETGWRDYAARIGLAAFF